MPLIYRLEIIFTGMLGVLKSSIAWIAETEGNMFPI